MASSDSHIDKPQRGHPKRPELPGVNINTGAQSINTEPSLFKEKVDPVSEMTARTTPLHTCTVKSVHVRYSARLGRSCLLDWCLLSSTLRHRGYYTDKRKRKEVTTLAE